MKWQVSKTPDLPHYIWTNYFKSPYLTFIWSWSKDMYLLLNSIMAVRWMTCVNRLLCLIITPFPLKITYSFIWWHQAAFTIQFFISYWADNFETSFFEHKRFCKKRNIQYSTVTTQSLQRLTGTMCQYLCLMLYPLSLSGSALALLRMANW